MGESYRRWRLPQLWEMVAADDAADAHLHLATLRRQQTALETQRDRLRVLRDRLAEGWPPDRSGAATAFLQRVKDMIEAMTHTALGAAELRTNVSHIVAAIAEVRDELAPLVEKYEAAASHPDPRVGRQIQKSLDDLARQIFVRSDKVVAEATASLAVSLPNYVAIRDRVELEAASSGQVSGGSPRTAVGGGSVGSIGSRDLARLTAPIFEPPTPVIGEEIDEGFSLAVDGSLEPSARLSVSYPEPTTSGSYGARDVAAISNGVIGAPIGAPVQSDVRTSNMRGPVIGSPPVGAPATSRAGIGGARLGRGQGGSPVGGPTIRSAGSSINAVSGYRDHSFEEYVARRRLELDDGEGQWLAPQGVTPLIEAPKERPHDVGPGVLGIDR